MDLLRREATIEGTTGTFVDEDERGALWEVRVSPERLGDIVRACGSGRTLEVTTEAGVYRALARRWWVLPDGDGLLVRIALEKRAAA